MTRNLVVCLDGTGGQLRARGNTNVLLLYKLLDHSDPTKQIAYYDPGVGTFASAGAWTAFARSISRISGLAFGSGLRQNLGEAYTWLMQNWAPGDQIFIFGFSRGAYTARALVGILQAVGLMRPGSENLIPYLVSVYARRGGEAKIDWDEVHLYSEVFALPTHGKSRALPVTYLGVWDTVKATGFLAYDIHWPFTNKLPNAVRIRHAVSIHEKRSPFKEKLIEPRSDGSLEEVWFAGVHSDVGGTFDDPTTPERRTSVPRLSTITLKWILEGAEAEGLLVKSSAVRTACAVTLAYANAELHRRGWAWRLAGTRNRRIPAGASVHASVDARSQSDSTFKAPTNVVWVDLEWAVRPSLSAEARADQ
jgi:Uncharacterized alpha/beta hydrolase domain (DUF2235)